MKESPGDPVKKSSSATYNIGYHLIWCPKYRRKVLVDDVERRFKEIAQEVARDNDWEIATMEVMPDHVHIFIKAKPVDSPQNIVARIKGRTSNYLRKEFPYLKTKLPSLWTRSYSCESIGSIFGISPYSLPVDVDPSGCITCMILWKISVFL